MKHVNSLPSWMAVLLLVFFVSCSGGEERPQQTATQKAQSPVLSAESRRLMDLLPDNNAVPGWTRGEEVRFFTPDNLFEYIDGAAENYLIYGFRQVVTADYSNPKKPSQAVLEIYRMKDPLNAFGIYASECNPDSDFKQIGAEGYIGGTALNFWSGPYYVKITVFQEDEGLKQDMLKLGEGVSQKIGQAGGMPPEIESFPRADLVPHSVRFLAKDVLGQTYFKEGFEAMYRRGESKTKLVIATPGDEAAAINALDQYRQFIASGGKVARELKAPGDGGFLGKDSYYGNMAAVRSGNRVIIALGGSSTDAALAQITAYLKKR
jgi:hypothetical protein